ncbi:MAG: tetratricopeptide repeat protein [Planctomycetaceae bacterium]|nr:tetratricopeptide repeat protein [Planctomycetaceae bacterium]
MAAIVLAGVLAYSNTFNVPFLFDDLSSVPNNPTIQRLWPIWTPLCPPNHGEPVSGRPLVNLSLAINHAISGNEVWSYHAGNLAIHLVAALLLFGVVRRTFALPSMRERFGRAGTPLALAIALVWVVHPLQTESVTYIVQRAESLVGLFYLLTLYCLIRGVTSSRPSYWYAGCVVACLLGMASKEVMASAPLIVFLYDRAFVAGSMAEAWRRRRWLYVAMGSTWLLLGGLVLSTGNRACTAGIGTGINSWEYLCTQFVAIVHYLRLSLWPQPLVFDYGHRIIHEPRLIVPCAAVVAMLAAATAVALWRSPKAGFLGACFFAVLGPTSSVIPVATQTMAEHRMYLPLAAILAGITVGIYLTARRFGHNIARSPLVSRAVGVCMLAGVCVAFAVLTYCRNVDYRSDLAIWTDTANKVPWSWRPHNNLGLALAARGRVDEAIAQYEEALRQSPDMAEAHINLGVSLAGLQRIDDAIAHHREALRTQPYNAAAHNNLGTLLGSQNRLQEAATELETAMKLVPNDPAVRSNLAGILVRQGRSEDAIPLYECAIRLDANSLDAHANFGIALANRGRMKDAIAQTERALRLAQQRNNAAFAEELQSRLRLYRAQADLAR